MTIQCIPSVQGGDVREPVYLEHVLYCKQSVPGTCSLRVMYCRQSVPGTCSLHVLYCRQSVPGTCFLHVLYCKQIGSGKLVWQRQPMRHSNNKQFLYLTENNLKLRIAEEADVKDTTVL